VEGVGSGKEMEFNIYYLTPLHFKTIKSGISLDYTTILQIHSITLKTYGFPLGMFGKPFPAPGGI